MLLLTPQQQAKLTQAKQFARETTQALLSGTQPIPLVTSLPLLNLPSLTASDPLDQRSLQIICRIYIGSINFSLSESDVKLLFQQFGFIKSINMSMDPATGKHKGYCFIEYDAVEAAVLAVEAMSGVEVGGRQLKVGRPNNFSQSMLDSLGKGNDCLIYIANVHELVDEENLESIFESFGKVLKCVLVPDFLTKVHRNYGYITFESAESSNTAVASMNGFELGGQILKVCKCLVDVHSEGMKSLAKAD
ncbi:Poly(U)-binding-splicing factor puf60, partial [Nowakowskiella sp. JEL0078]